MDVTSGILIIAAERSAYACCSVHELIAGRRETFFRLVAQAATTRPDDRMAVDIRTSRETA